MICRNQNTDKTLRMINNEAIFEVGQCVLVKVYILNVSCKSVPEIFNLEREKLAIYLQHVRDRLYNLQTNK